MIVAITVIIPQITFAKEIREFSPLWLLAIVSGKLSELASSKRLSIVRREESP